MGEFIFGGKGMVKLPREEVQRRLGPQFVLIKQSRLSSPDSIVFCKKCEHQFNVPLRLIIKWGKCRICEIKSSGQRKFDKQQVEYRLHKRRLKPLSKYEGGSKFIWLKCLDCGRKFIARASMAMRQINEAMCLCKRLPRGCHGRSSEELEKMFAERGLKVAMTLYGKKKMGVKRDYKRHFTCMKCGYEWDELPSNVERRKVPCRNNECRKKTQGEWKAIRLREKKIEVAEPILTEEEELKRIDEGLDKLYEENGWDGTYFYEREKLQI